MISTEAFTKMALSFPGSSSAPHFDRTAFKTKKIFATLDEKKNRACIMLSPEDQAVFALFDAAVIYAVSNKWGLSGATYFELKTVKKSMLKDALQQAYNRSLEKYLKKK